MSEHGAGENAAAALLAWFDRHRRDLPWRAAPGVRPDPYAVWLSETMLQQTTTTTVARYFGRFLAEWPTVEALADADLDSVMRAWAGLGYYARARNLHACAREVARAHGGRFPQDEAGLRRLPGVGAYTAAAVSAIAFDRPAVVVDGNVERVMARLFAVEAPLPGARGELRARAAELTPRRRPGDYAQAAMDLGATVCTPRRPHCLDCPWRGRCRAQARGTAAELPRRSPRPARPLRHGVVFWIVRDDGAALFVRRPPRGLLGGTVGLPTTEWGDAPVVDAEPPAPARRLRTLPGVVTHGFTHFRLELRVRAGVAQGPARSGLWLAPGEIDAQALSTLMRKAVAHARAGAPGADGHGQPS